MRKLPVIVERVVDQAQIERLERARKYDTELQVELAELGARTTCSKGCSSCCLHPKLVSVLEGLTLYKHLLKTHQWSSILKKALEEHSLRTWNLAPEIWLMGAIPCPLLQDDLCTAYDARPLSCRLTYATGDPHFCHPLRITEGSTLVDRSAAMAESIEAEQKLARKLRTHNLLMPISSALLAAERIATGEIQIQDVTNDFLERQAELG